MTRARDLMQHRGPDDEGLFTAPRVGLGHRRLTIVDLERGRQPFSSDDGRQQLVYNGEVYNHRDLRRQLKEQGHRFHTTCDTETVLRLLRQCGEDCVQELRGMFAFAAWNAEEEDLFLARDRLGIKPLYYAHLNDGSICFGSEIKAVVHLANIRPDLNREALPDYLANHATCGEHTLFSGVKQLLPGHTISWRNGDVRVKRYWEPDFTPTVEEEPGSSVVGRYRDLLYESVRLRLMADVPLGIFLSGGIDSTSIAAAMAEHDEGDINSFSVGFEDSSANELEYARMAAKEFNTRHHEVVLDADDYFRALPSLIWHRDEPIAHPASIPLYYVSQLARQHVKVVLTGEGSDELLGGYGRHWKTLPNIRIGRKYQHFAPPTIRRGVASAVHALPRASVLRQKAERTFLCHPADVESLYLDNFAVFSRAQQQELLSSTAEECLEEGDPYGYHSSVLQDSSEWPLLQQLLHLDTCTYLQHLLSKQDRMSMAASLESRVPFLDHKLVEYSAQLPPNLKVRGRRGKYILRKAMEDAIPDAILNRPKMGFPVPFGNWARGEYRSTVEELLLGPRAASRELFNLDYVGRILHEHQEGQVDHSQRLWSLVNLELWQQIFLDDDLTEVSGLDARLGAAASHWDGEVQVHASTSD